MNGSSKSQGVISNSQRGGVSTSSGSSLCPTARSVSIETATNETSPSNMPTALSNSVVTAIGATNSDFEGAHGMSDTSAGSSQQNTKSDTSTALTPSSPQLLLNDLRRGNIFGRQSTTNEPKSVTNVTFANTTFTTTASSASSHASSSQESPLKHDAKPTMKSLQQEKTSLMTARSEKSKISTASRSRMVSQLNKNKQELRKNKEKKADELTKLLAAVKTHGISEKSQKSEKSGKVLDKSRRQPASERGDKSAGRSSRKAPASAQVERSEKSRRVGKSAKASASGSGESSKASGRKRRSTKMTKKQKEQQLESSQKSAKKSTKTAVDASSKSMGRSQKDQNRKDQKNDGLGVNMPPIGGISSDKPDAKNPSVRLTPQNPAVASLSEKPTGAENVITGPSGNKYSLTSAKKPGDFQQTKSKHPMVNSTYLFPGAGQTTRRMDSVASQHVTTRSPALAAPPQDAHCVYDVSKLTSSQRRVPAASSPLVGALQPPSMQSQKPRTLFGGVRKPAADLSSSRKPAKSLAAPAGSRVIVYGTTPDGKNQVEFTIQMRIVSGEALGLSKDPVDLIPKKVVIGGKEIAVEPPQRSTRSDSKFELN